MKPNPDKYQVKVLGKRENNLHFEAADETDQTKLLEVLLDNMLKFDAHISNMCRKVSAQINALNRLKNILSVKTKKSLYRSFVLPYFYYCSQVWHHCGKRNTNKLEKVRGPCFMYIRISKLKELLKKINSGLVNNN